MLKNGAKYGLRKSRTEIKRWFMSVSFFMGFVIVQNN